MYLFNKTVLEAQSANFDYNLEKMLVINEKISLNLCCISKQESNYVDKEINNSIWGEKLKIFAKTGVLNNHTVASGIIFIIIWSSIYHAKN